MQRNEKTPLSVFISYAHEDEPWRRQLEVHLSLLRRQGLIADWHDRQILAGQEWAQEIDEHLETASIILLLISADFVASDYCYDKEMKRALERHQRGEARVIPIILRPCDWQSSPFARLQSLPRDGKAITTWQNQDEAFLVIAEGVRRVIERQQIPARPLSHVERQNRTRLMKRMRTTWIEGVLEHSLHQEALIALNLQEQSDALVNPWRLEVQETNLPPRPLPIGTSIVRVYDEAVGELLILGEPGAGKTTLLLELAHILLERAEQEQHHRMPIVFNLSSWAQKRQPLATWLVEELHIKYQIPDKVGQVWIETDQVLLLFDGLDEVRPEHRSACVNAINAYRQEHDLVSVVVCSRSTEYLAQAARVMLHRAVMIQPLTAQQIDEYLSIAGKQVEALQVALHSDPELLEIVKTPLMLNVMMLAYHGMPVGNLLAGGSSKIQRRVFEQYIQRMLQRRGARASYTPRQVIQWLTWLAQQMARQGQTEFYIERIEPDWLMERQSRRIYDSITAILFTTLVYGLFSMRVGAFYGLLLTGAAIHLTGGLVGGLLGGLAGIVAALESYTVGPRGGRLRLLLGGIIAGIGGWFIGGLYGGLLGGLLSGLYVGLFNKKIISMEPAEIITWSWTRMWRGLFRGDSLVTTSSVFLTNILLVGIARGLYSGMASGLFIGLISGLANGLVIGLILALGSLLFHGVEEGLSGDMLEKHILATPNEGTWRSLRNGTITGLVFGLIFGLDMGLTCGWFYGPVFGLVAGLLLGLGSGLVTGLLSGGFTCIEHAVLRLLLWRTGSAPWGYPRFLDYTAERILLRKVGGGYIFIHRLLLDYFASLEKKES